MAWNKTFVCALAQRLDMEIDLVLLIGKLNFLYKLRQTGTLTWYFEFYLKNILLFLFSMELHIFCIIQRVRVN
jgi:hypothetical protein